jgi:mono/diheme cytochrome c family protein
MKRLAVLLLLLIPWSALALVAEERPGIPYRDQVLFLEKKVMEGDRVDWVTLAYADPAKSGECRNFIDVLGGRELFAGVAEKSWLLVDFQLRSLVVRAGFSGDADVSGVVPCGDYEACCAERDRLAGRQPEAAPPAEPQAPAEQPAPALADVGDRLLVGRQLVKAARCRGCHRIEGFGADHAPSLTWRRHKYQPGWLIAFLKAPYRMRPGMTSLMMLDYTSPNAVPNLQPEEVPVLADYLQQLAWFSSPPGRFSLEPWQNYNCFDCHTRLYRQEPLPHAPSRIPEPYRGRIAAAPAWRTCLACHAFGDLGPQGDAAAAFPLAPDLLLTVEKLRTDYILAYVRDPAYVQAGSTMPRLPLSDRQLDELETRIEALRAAMIEGKVRPVHNYYRMKKGQGGMGQTK